MTARGVISRVLACFLLLTGLSLLAQENVPTPSNNPAQATDTCLRRGISLTIWRTRENADLKASDLQVAVDGRSVPVLSLSKENLSPRIVLLVDTSGSMGDAGTTWGNSLLAVGFALDSLPPHSPVALVTFSEKIDITGFGDPEQIRRKLLALKQTKPHGRTALYDSIKQAVRLFGAPQFGDAVYIVSDGGENIRPEERKQVAGELVRHGIRAFAFIVQQPAGGARSPEQRTGTPDLADFAKLTGGSWITAVPNVAWSKSEDAAKDRDWTRAQLQSPYALEFQLAASPAKPVKLKITTSARGFEISYPQHIEPCSTGDLAKR